MKLVTTKFKLGGLYERHVVATWNLGNHLSICLQTQENQEKPVSRFIEITRTNSRHVSFVFVWFPPHPHFLHLSSFWITLQCSERFVGEWSDYFSVHESESNGHHSTEHGLKDDKSPCAEYWTKGTNHPFPGKVKRVYYILHVLGFFFLSHIWNEFSPSNFVRCCSLHAEQSVNGEVTEHVHAVIKLTPAVSFCRRMHILLMSLCHSVVPDDGEGQNLVEEI